MNLAIGCIIALTSSLYALLLSKIIGLNSKNLHSKNMLIENINFSLQIKSWYRFLTRFVIEIIWTNLLYNLILWLFGSIKISLIYVIIIVFRLVWLTGIQFLFYHKFYDN